MKGILVILMVILLSLTYGCISKETSIEQKIKENLIGNNISYYGIAGQPVNFTISADDIKSIEKVEIKGELFWKVEIGKDLIWNIYMDKDGKNIVKKEQLFVT